MALATTTAPATVSVITADRRHLRLAAGLALSAGVSLLVVISSWTTDSRLGAPLYWAWILTGLQVIALWAAGRRRWWAWLLGGGVQPVWIVYAILTGQLGFVLGCVVSAVVQLRNYLKQDVDDGADARPRH